MFTACHPVLSAEARVALTLRLLGGLTTDEIARAYLVAEPTIVLMLDQRGTGRSSPVGLLPDLSPAQQAAHLAHFRADSIVADAELVRAELGVERWSVLGQSFGGFCVTRYLSAAPDGLSEAYITGGLPAFEVSVDDVYALTYRLPSTAAAATTSATQRTARACARCTTRTWRLPSGDELTPLRVRQLGLQLGMSDGAENLHHLLELPFHSAAFLHDADDPLSFARDPIYSLLQEACWADGTATRWAAARVLPGAYEREPDLFFGEHILPGMFDEYAALVRLRDAADLLAQHEWPRLYDFEVLAANEVPSAAAIYAEDLYVPMEFSREAGRRIRGLKPWITNEYQHNGLRANGEAVLGRLIDLVRGRA